MSYHIKHASVLFRVIHGTERGKDIKHSDVTRHKIGLFAGLLQNSNLYENLSNNLLCENSSDQVKLAVSYKGFKLSFYSNIPIQQNKTSQSTCQSIDIRVIPGDTRKN